jgi:HAD superfamily hydrolase (TIGR01509 family)
VLTPQESGYAKNDPNMYQYFLNKFALQPDECVFIDDKQENIYAAQQTGMYTIVYRTIHQLKDRLDQLDIIS